MEFNKITFSVIMPCYNSEAYVETAIESIKNQTYSDWELIAVNDGSKDDTLNILNKYSVNDNRIKVFSKENGGYVSAVNFGLDNVTGDYFLLLGSDDYLDTGLFECIYKNICELSYVPDCVAFRTRKVKNGVVKGVDSYTSFETICSAQKTTYKDYVERHPEHGAIFSIKDTSKCFKTGLLKDLRYFGKYGIDSDGIFTMLFCHRASSFLNIPYDGYYWIMRDDSVSAIPNFSLEKYIDMINNWRKFYCELSTIDFQEISPAEKKYVGKQCGLLVDVSMDFGVAVKHYKYIKDNAKFIIDIAKSYAPQFINKPIKIVSMCPPLFAVLYKIVRLLKHN